MKLLQPVIRKLVWVTFTIWVTSSCNACVKTYWVWNSPHSWCRTGEKWCTVSHTCVNLFFSRPELRTSNVYRIEDYIGLILHMDKWNWMDKIVKSSLCITSKVCGSFHKGQPRKTWNQEIRSDLTERKDRKVPTKHINALEVIHKKWSNLFRHKNRC